MQSQSPTISVSNHKSIESSCLSILVTHETVSTLSNGPLLGIQQRTQVLVESHLSAEVLGVILDISLVLSENLHDLLLLVQLHLEVILEGLVFR